VADSFGIIAHLSYSLLENTAMLIIVAAAIALAGLLAAPATTTTTAPAAAASADPGADALSSNGPPG
jgi:uncharacterized lipoprotein YajG